MFKEFCDKCNAEIHQGKRMVVKLSGEVEGIHLPVEATLCPRCATAMWEGLKKPSITGDPTAGV